MEQRKYFNLIFMDVQVFAVLGDLVLSLLIFHPDAQP